MCILHIAYCMLHTAYVAHCICCTLHMLHTAYAAHCICCTLHMLHTAYAAHCICYTLHMLHTAYAAYCIWCMLHTACCILQNCILHTYISTMHTEVPNYIKTRDMFYFYLINIIIICCLACS